MSTSVCVCTCVRVSVSVSVSVSVPVPVSVSVSVSLLFVSVSFCVYICSLSHARTHARTHAIRDTQGCGRALERCAQERGRDLLTICQIFRRWKTWGSNLRLSRP